MIAINKNTWHEVYEKVLDSEIRETLQKFDLSKYSKKIKNIYFTYIAQPPDSFHKNDVWTEGEDIYLSLKLSYKHLLSADEQKTKRMMARLFLASIDLYDKLGIDFDSKRFKKDVHKIFKAKGFLDRSEKQKQP